MPKVSVTMAVRNVETFLAESIESVLEQTFEDFEFVIVDFGSTDCSSEIVRGYAAKDSRISRYEIPVCSLPAARNAAWSRARGQYVAVMDADDVCLPERLRCEVDFLDRNPDVGLVGGAVEWINSLGRSLVVYHMPSQDEELRLALLERCPFWHPSVLVRREALALVGGYRDAFVLAHDYDMELRVAEHFRVANLMDVVLRYRIHPNQISLTKQREQSLCKLAAQASASGRKGGQPDPFDGASKITSELLTSVGVDEATQERHLFNDYHRWIRHMYAAREYAAAVAAVHEVLRTSAAKYGPPWAISDMWLIAASAHWRQGDLLRSLVAAVRAVVSSPRVLGRPVKRGVRQLKSFREAWSRPASPL